MRRENSEIIPLLLVFLLLFSILSLAMLDSSFRNEPKKFSFERGDLFNVYPSFDGSVVTGISHHNGVTMV